MSFSNIYSIARGGNPMGSMGATAGTASNAHVQTNAQQNVIMQTQKVAQGLSAPKPDTTFPPDMKISKQNAVQPVGFLPPCPHWVEPLFHVDPPHLPHPNKDKGPSQMAYTQQK